MKRFAIVTTLLLTFAAGAFAQADLQPLAVVKLNKSETITLRQLKSRVEFVEKQYEGYGMKRSMSVADKRTVLDSLISEKLIAQAATKEGLAISDSQVDAAFLSTFSQQLGQQVTEAQLNELLQEQMGMSLSDYLKENAGMTVPEYKAYLKSQLVAQQYVYAKKQNELQQVAATDEEIRKAYDLNKSTFVWNDMIKLFLVIVPKSTNSSEAQALATNLRNQYVKDKNSAGSIKNSADNNKKYRAGDLIVAKTAQQAQQLGWTYDKIIELFGNKVDYVSDITETENDFQFYAVLQKYDAKLLSLSDIVQPETTITVYDYIKNNLTQQKQSQYFTAAAQEIAKGLDTPENVDRKKTGEALDKLLLDW